MVVLRWEDESEHRQFRLILESLVQVTRQLFFFDHKA